MGMSNTPMPKEEGVSDDREDYRVTDHDMKKLLFLWKMADESEEQTDVKKFYRDVYENMYQWVASRLIIQYLATGNIVIEKE